MGLLIGVVMAAPFITALVDGTGLVIYFLIARAVLGLSWVRTAARETCGPTLMIHHGREYRPGDDWSNDELL